ncbi:MAG TPA: STAS domain-containing protein [Streptosporangiaceae bacterium]|nr:STAS domain-containing protein [Streptosporangiaceae bacterium]
MLSGEADLASAGRLRELIDAQLASGVRQLTIDVSGLRYADSASVRELLLAARTLHERDGHLILLRPQRPVARLLELNGADRLMTISATSTTSTSPP